MISAALWLLKILGILVLVLFALLLLVALLVLFSAVCYQAEGSYLGNTLKANGKISWLFHILTIRFSFEETVRGDVRIFGIPVWSTDKKGAEKPNETQPEMENGPENFQSEEEEVLSIQELGAGTGDRDRGIPELSRPQQHKAEPEQEEAEQKPEESFLETWIRRLSEKGRSLFQKGKQMAAEVFSFCIATPFRRALRRSLNGVCPTCPIGFCPSNRYYSIVAKRTEFKNPSW